MTDDILSPWRKQLAGAAETNDFVLRESRRLLVAASHALKSYAFGNSATDLAEELSASIDRFLATGEPETISGKAELQRRA